MTWALGVGVAWVAAGALAAGCGGESDSTSSASLPDAGAGAPSSVGGAGGSGGDPSDGGAGGAAVGGGAGSSTGGVAGAGATTGMGGAGGVDATACAAACDRVVSCAERDCPGVNAGNSAPLSEGCVRDCNADFLSRFDATTPCGRVVDALSATSPDLATLCGENGACVEACQHVGVCTAAECAAVDATGAQTVATDCLDWCTADNAAALASTPCPALVEGLRGQADAGPNPFDLVCELGTDCASASECAEWALELAGCLVDSCDPSIADYATGLEELLMLTCQDPADCTTVAAAAFVNDPAVTCSHEAIAPLGTQAPFANVCSDNVGATAAELRTACEAIVDCSFPEGPESVDLCMALVALTEDPALVPCLVGAGTSCPTLGGCFSSSGP